MISDKTVQLVIQGVVAVSLISLAGWYAVNGQAPPDWLVVAVMAVLGALFGFNAANGYLNSRRKGGK